MTIFLRDPGLDKRKSASALKEQLENKHTCKAPGCNQPITMHQGPGDKHLCREHQISQREYGGLGRLDRPWTFSRGWCCVWCGYSPKDDPWFDNPPIPWDDEAHKNRAMRSTLIGDHIVRRTDGGDDTEDNVQTLCQTCNSKKTALHKDYRRGSSNSEASE